MIDFGISIAREQIQEIETMTNQNMQFDNPMIISNNKNYSNFRIDSPPQIAIQDEDIYNIQNEAEEPRRRVNIIKELKLEIGDLIYFFNSLKNNMI